MPLLFPEQVLTYPSLFYCERRNMMTDCLLLPIVKVRELYLVSCLHTLTCKACADIFLFLLTSNVAVTLVIATPETWLEIHIITEKAAV